MKVYIAGAISGVSDYAERFGQAEERLKKAGHVVLNPAKLPVGMSKADYMRICLAMIDSADIVYLLPGANLSKGAAVEKRYCEYIGKPIAVSDGLLRSINTLEWE